MPASSQPACGELGAEIARDYEGLEPILVGSLKATIPFICDLSRAVPIHHALDFVELAGYGQESDDRDGIRFLKDLSDEIENRHVLLVDEVVDTGLTMNYFVALAPTPQSRVARTRRSSSTGRTGDSSTTCRFATSASRSRTSSSSATGSTWTSSTATCRISGSCAAPRSPAGPREWALSLPEF